MKKKARAIFFIENCLIFVFFALSCQSVFAKYFSQNGQDKFLNEKIFKFKKKGIFVDIGAHDGVTYSNTYYFERYLGWDGICVEPIPEVFRELVKRRRCTCINGCIATFGGKSQFLKISGYSEMLSGLIDFYHPKHTDRIQAELDKYGGDSEIIEVNCFPLGSLLAQFNITNIDYLSIDTEGSELEVVQSIDFSSVQIGVISIENPYKDERIKRYLAMKGYKFLKKVGSDEIYHLSMLSI